MLTSYRQHNAEARTYNSFAEQHGITSLQAFWSLHNHKKTNKFPKTIKDIESLLEEQLFEILHEIGVDIGTGVEGGVRTLQNRLKYAIRLYRIGGTHPEAT